MARILMSAVLITITVNEFLKRCFGVELTPEQKEKLKELEAYPPTLQVTLDVAHVPGEQDAAEKKPEQPQVPGPDSTDAPNPTPPIAPVPVGNAEPKKDPDQAKDKTEPVADPEPAKPAPVADPEPAKPEPVADPEPAKLEPPKPAPPKRPKKSRL